MEINLYSRRDQEGRIILEKGKIEDDAKIYRFKLSIGTKLSFLKEIKINKQDFEIVEGVVEYDLKNNEWVAKLKNENKFINDQGKFYISYESHFQDRVVVYIDFQREYEDGKFTLDTMGTERDLKKHNINLFAGQKLLFWSDDSDYNGDFDPLIVEGVVEYDVDIKKWIAKIDKNEIKNESDL